MNLARDFNRLDRDLSAADQWADKWGNVDHQVDRMAAALRNDSLTNEDRWAVIMDAVSEIRDEKKFQEANQ